MLKVGIVGAGFMGDTHAMVYKLLSQVELVAVADIEADKRQQWVEKYGGQAYENLEQMLQDDAIDIIDICLPTYLHCENVLLAARAGRHILCEKPIALTLDDAEAMIAATEKAGVKFMVAQVIRFWPEYQYIRKVVTSGELGQLRMLHATRLSSPPLWAWRAWAADPHLSGGGVVDLHIHDLDYIYWLMGRPRHVYALGRHSHTGTVDEVVSLLGFDNERLAVAEGNLVMPSGFPFTMTLQAICEHGVIEYHSRDMKPLTVFKEGQPPLYPKLPPPISPKRIQRQNTVGNIAALGGYFNEISYFVNCVENDNVPSLCPATEAMFSLRLTLAARESIETGETVRLE